MYAAVDATDVDMQPIRDARVMIVWFFMLFMLIGSYLVMNLFVGVIIDNFNKVTTTQTDLVVNSVVPGCLTDRLRFNERYP